MKPHKHAEVIKAWADGAQIQFRNVRTDRNWTDMPMCSPTWYETVEYRIKPEVKPDIVVCAYAFARGVILTDAKEKLANLILTFDGDTRELKSAEVKK